MKAGYPGHDAMREKAERAFGAAELRGYDKSSRPSDKYGCMKRGIGGAMNTTGSYKYGGKSHSNPIRRNMGGMMGIPVNTADSIQQANQLLSNAAANGTGLKRGGKAYKNRSRYVDGGKINQMGTDEFNIGRKVAGFNNGGKAQKHATEIEIEFVKKIPSKGMNRMMEKHIYDARNKSVGKMCGYETGGEIKKAIGGVGKIRHGQMTKKGAQIAPRARFKG